MRGDLKIRKVRTASGATAVQVVQNKGTSRSFLKHIGSANDEHELELLLDEAKQYVETHCRQPNLFTDTDRKAPLASPISLPATPCLPVPENATSVGCRNSTLTTAA